MDIEKVLREKPLAEGVLVRGAPAGEGRDEHLVRQVMALANADLKGIRCLLFGVEQGAAGAVSLIGLRDEDVVRLEAQRDLCREAIEPSPELVVVTTEIAGKRVAALVIGDWSNPPYVAGQRAPAPLRAGECWLFDAQGMRCASRADLDVMYATRRQRQPPAVLVGLGDDPCCEFLEVTVPDASQPPSRTAALKLRSAIAAKRAAAAVVGQEDTNLARLAHARIFGADIPFQHRSLDTLVQALEAVPETYREADLRYRLEERAARLNFCVMNGRPETLRGAAIEITLPAVAGLMIATGVHSPPGDSSTGGVGYPEVRRSNGSFRIRCSLGDLAPGSLTRLLTTPLRMAVDQILIGQKIAIRFSLVADGLPSACRGRLRVRFGR
jgi:hypothetical protein